MNDAEVIPAVKASYAGIHMDVPLDVIERRGRRLRARRRLPGLAGAAVTVAALALAVAALVPGGGSAMAPAGSTGGTAGSLANNRRAARDVRCLAHRRQARASGQPGGSMPAKVAHVGTSAAL